jgi:uncharacterized membrane protein YccC
LSKQRAHLVYELPAGLVVISQHLVPQLLVTTVNNVPEHKREQQQRQQFKPSYLHEAVQHNLARLARTIAAVVDALTKRCRLLAQHSTKQYVLCTSGQA